MPTFLVAYGTSEGQTGKIAERIAATLTDRGHEASARDVATLPAAFDLEGYDAAVVGSSIHVDEQQDSVVEFVGTHRDALRTRPTAFFQVSLSSAVDDETRQAEAAEYVEDFVAATDWHPDRIVLFGGALRYSQYGFRKRLVLKRIARDATGIQTPLGITSTPTGTRSTPSATTSQRSSKGGWASRPGPRRGSRRPVCRQPYRRAWLVDRTTSRRHGGSGSSPGGRA